MSDESLDGVKVISGKRRKSDFLRQLKLPTAVKKREACLAFARTDRLEN